MSLDELHDDIKRNRAEAKRCKTFEELRDHVANTLWPYQEAKLEVVEEIDDAVGEMVERTEDYLHPETAAVFATLASASLELSGELRKRAAGDELLTKKLDALDALCSQAMAMLGEITMVSDEEGDDEDDDKAEGGNA